MNKLIFKLFYSKGIFILTLMILAGCAPKITGEVTQGMPHETAKNSEVYFCPREDCSKVFESHIKSANFSAHCAFYDIDLKNIINSLAKKSKTADVKVIIDSSNYNEQIKGDGVRLDDDKQLMHNKFCVIDNNVVITGSFNPTDNDNNYNNNNIIVIYSRILARNYEDEFNELWNGKFGQGAKVENPALKINNIRIENYFCPEDNCAARITDLIRDAKESVYFMAFSFTNEEIADALLTKSNLDIRGIFDAQQSSNKYSQYKRLKEFGIAVKKDTSKYKMHHKVFVIDNQSVVTGSFNPTLSADTKNDENLLIMHDEKMASEFLGEFGRLWA